jgi:hypothetical protein
MGDLIDLAEYRRARGLCDICWVDILVAILGASSINMSSKDEAKKQSVPPVEEVHLDQ